MLPEGPGGSVLPRAPERNVLPMGLSEADGLGENVPPVGPGGNVPPVGLGGPGGNSPPVGPGGNMPLVGPEEIDCGGCEAIRSSTTFEIKSSWLLHSKASSAVNKVGSSS